MGGHFDNESEVADLIAAAMADNLGYEQLPKWLYMVLVASNRHICGVSFAGCDDNDPPLISETVERANDMVQCIIQDLNPDDLDGAQFQLIDLSRHDTEGPVLMLTAPVQVVLMAKEVSTAAAELVASSMDTSALDDGVPPEWVAEFGGES